MAERTIFDHSSVSTEYFTPARPASDIDPGFMRTMPAGLPAISESEVVRHYTNLSRRNFGVDTGFYPLGSCTMKYNPRVNEEIAGSAALAELHPLTPEEGAQGVLAMLDELAVALAELSGMDAVSLQPAAGAHGELTGLLMIRAYHSSRGDLKRTKVIVPDSSHGTNPATSAVAGLTVKQIASRKDGLVDLESLRKECDGTVAAFMLTNPNTLGLFEKEIREIASIVHAAGGLLYYDGANFNALMGVSRPGDMDFDAMQFNLHKTFSTPHGGGGPGSGPVAVKAFLAEFLPGPVLAKRNGLVGWSTPAKSIGRMKSFHGHVGIAARAWAYVTALGAEGLLKSSRTAVLNANYVLAGIRDVLDVPMGPRCLHEFVASAERFKTAGVHTLDIAKRLIDYGYHPPTIYFPLIVKEALMVEPTETETKATLDAFVSALRTIVEEIAANPSLLLDAPHATPVRRVDEAKAAREIVQCP